LTEPKTEASPIVAAATLGRALLQIASAAIALYALGYFIGWAEAEAYFSQLGASWAVSLLPPLRLLQKSAPVVIPMALCVILSIEWLAKSETAGRQKLGLFSFLTPITAFALFIVAGVLGRMPGRAIAGYWCVFAGAVLFACYAGLLIGQLIARLSTTHRLLWSGYHIWLLRVVALFGLVVAPFFVGDSQAKIDRESGELPSVQLEDDHTREWHLVDVTEDSALLMSGRGGPQEPAVFRVVALTDIKLIAAARSSRSKP
jgi:hypothetical protein